MRSAAGGHHDVQDLGLRHRDADLGELRGVADDEPVHHPLVAVEDPLDVGGAPVALLASDGMFGNSVQFGRPTLYRVVPASGSRTIGPVTPPLAAGPRDRAPIPRDPPPPGAAAVAAAGAGVRHARRGPARLAPVRPARDRRSQPRPGAGRPDRRLPARVDRRLPVRGRATCTRRTTRASRSCPTAELPWYRITWDESRRDHDGSRVRRARPARRGAAGPDPAGRAAVLDRLRAARRHRLVLAADQPGPGDPRGPGRGGHPGAGQARGQPPGLRPRRAAVPGRAARRAGPPSASSAGTSCCRAIEPTACSGARGVASCGPASAGRVAADRPSRRAERSSWPSWSRTGPSSR